MCHFHYSVLEINAIAIGIMLLGCSKKNSLSSEEQSHHLLQFICKILSSVIAFTCRAFFMTK